MEIRSGNIDVRLMERMNKMPSQKAIFLNAETNGVNDWVETPENAFSYVEGLARSLQVNVRNKNTEFIKSNIAQMLLLIFDAAEMLSIDAEECAYQLHTATIPRTSRTETKRLL